MEDPDNVIEKTVTTLGQAQPSGFETGPGSRDAPTQTGCDHRDHHAGNRLAAPLRPRLLDGGGAQKARPDTRLRKDGEERIYHIVANDVSPKRKGRSGHKAA